MPENNERKKYVYSNLKNEEIQMESVNFDSEQKSLAEVRTFMILNFLSSDWVFKSRTLLISLNR